VRKLILALVVSMFLGFGGTAHAYLLVEDIPNLSTNIINEIKNYIQYIEQTANQLTQITNQVTQIENQMVQLERFGNPQYYVNLLNLNQFFATASVLTSGIGQTIAGYRQVANGVFALSYTANGLYANLTGTLDRFGNPVQYNTDAFKKFSAVNDMVESYNTQQRTFNTQMASLQSQLTTALSNLNAASTQMATEKYGAQVNAIHAQINALNANSTLGGQRAAIQQLSNQNDAARTQEASRQQEIQERTEDIQLEAKGFSNLIGGGAGGTVLP
jgi:predicted  nucleic acid-binding Zn-ribbon protein